MFQIDPLGIAVKPLAAAKSITKGAALSVSPEESSGGPLELVQT